MRTVVAPWFGRWISERLAPFVRRLSRDTSALALIEFAYTLPLFVGFGIVGIECTNVVLAHQKAERIASTLADQISSNMVPPNERQIDDLFEAANLIAAPFDFALEGNAIITAVLGAYDVADDQVQNKVAWQRCSAQGRFESRIGRQWDASGDIAEGPRVNLPSDIELLQNEMVIVSEVFLPYSPLVSDAIAANLLPSDRVVRQTSVFRTRGDVLFSVTPVVGVLEKSC